MVALLRAHHEEGRDVLAGTARRRVGQWRDPARTHTREVVRILTCALPNRMLTCRVNRRGSGLPSWVLTVTPHFTG